MKQLNTTIAGLDIQSDYLTVAQYSPDEHAVMLVAIQPLSGGGGIASDAVSAELGVLKGKFKFGSASINCSLSGEHAVIKKFPVEQNEKDPEAALQWELSQHIIGSVDEYAFDFQHCGTGADGLDEYLTVAYRREQVRSFATVLKRHKLVCGIVDLDLFALVNVFEANFPEYTDRPVLLLHAEAARAKLIITHHGKYVDHDFFSYDDSPDPRTLAELLQQQAARLCSYATLSGGNAMIPVFATGSLFAQADFLETVQSVSGNVALLHPFKKIGCRVGVDNEQLAAYLPQLAVAVGCALRGNDEP
jgi:Tfp pilus assembly PilM family ATPase